MSSSFHTKHCFLFVALVVFLLPVRESSSGTWKRENKEVDSFRCLFRKQQLRRIWRKRRHYKRIKRQREERWLNRLLRKRVLPRLSIQIRSLRPSGSIDREKLRLSIQHKLKRITYCYQLLFMERRNQKKHKTTKKKKKKKILGELAISMKLNPFGRSLSLRLKKSRIPKAEQDCFFWYLRGRKFFPPEGNREMNVNVVFRIILNPPKQIKKKRKKRR